MNTLDLLALVQDNNTSVGFSRPGLWDLHCHTGLCGPDVWAWEVNGVPDFPGNQASLSSNQERAAIFFFQEKKYLYAQKGCGNFFSKK